MTSASWAAAHGAVLPPTAMPAVGDAVLYGTGPQSTATSVHVGIVTQVWPDGAIMTVGRRLRARAATATSPSRSTGRSCPPTRRRTTASPIYAFAQP